jgi:NAD(P)-dependent dehydrogenase (short-subunit alcohol dehydrogenase family)
MREERPVALVTGARRGIGRASCVALAQAGYDVLGCDVAEDGFSEAAAAVQAQGGRFAHRLCDVSDIAAIGALVDWAWSEGNGIEAVVNNAGVGALQRGDPLAITAESWDRCLDINARGSFFVAQMAARRMVAEGAPQRGPRGIVFVSSANAIMASPDRTEYSASKAAVSMVARCLALRLAEDGIPVHEIRPGVIRTDMTAPVAARYSQRIAEGLSPIRRWGEAEDVARAIAMLLTGAIPFSTGDAFHVDGGLHLHRL